MVPDARLKRLATAIAEWRRTRTKHGPMPEVLWREAAVLARSFGVCPVSRALGIGYESLQQRVPRSPPRPTAVAPSQVRFVELSGAQVTGGASEGGAVIEVGTADGARLVIRLAPDTRLDVTALVGAFRVRS
jgi:hypothetical protein